ncbi:hypothetical protein FDC57_07045 [Clostridium botulinum]|nr:hypothetical protein [Clostridium botulinum]MBY6802453.1 hypothetical protein [Clostridium botulinum]MBY6812590.1 hypothetical protein [Clostridium botulinum]MBY6987598.1 hypothetical protein [Clostridium botulinum]NFP03927.1 hypothetical protein [Clostridium botulinum]
MKDFIIASTKKDLKEAIELSKRAKGIGKLTPYIKIIDKYIVNGHTSIKILEIIKSNGYAGSGSMLRNYISQWKRNTRKKQVNKTIIYIY